MFVVAIILMSLYVVLFAMYLQVEKNKQKMNYFNKLKKAKMVTEIIGNDKSKENK